MMYLSSMRISTYLVSKMAILKCVLLLVLISKRSLIAIHVRGFENDGCLMQIINKYMDHTAILLYRENESAHLYFPFNETIAFTLQTLSKGPYVEFDHTRVTMTDVIVYIEDINGIFLNLDYIWENMLWNFKSRHMILLKQITTAGAIEKLATKKQWQGYLLYNIVIGFYDKDDKLHFFVWFPNKPDNNCSRREDLEYLGPCGTLEVDPFVVGVYEKLRQCPLKLSMDVCSTPVVDYVNLHVIDSFVKWEGIPGR